MKKHCIIFVGNIYSAPYLKYYLKYLNGTVDLIYWNRSNQDVEIEVNEKFIFNYPVTKFTLFKKILGYLKFKKHAINIIKKKKYDNLIVFPTQTGILLQKVLKKHYSQKYVIDIRDYSFEHNKIYYAKLRNLLKYAREIIISSPGFIEFLPKDQEYNYTLAHNFDENSFDNIKNKHISIKKENPIIISYIGYVRFIPQLEKFILKFKNNPHFLLKFIGKDSKKLELFCKNQNIHNVILIDYFHPQKTYDYYEETDIVFNLYGNNTPLLDYALSNKLYFAANFKKPIIVCPNTYMEKVSKTYNFGITVDLEDEAAADNLYRNYNHINVKMFNEGCETFLNKVVDENKSFINLIKLL